MLFWDSLLCWAAPLEFKMDVAKQLAPLKLSEASWTPAASPAGGGEVLWRGNRKSFCPFVSFLLLMSQTQVDTFCCFITFCVSMCERVQGNDAWILLACLLGFLKERLHNVFRVVCVFLPQHNDLTVTPKPLPPSWSSPSPNFACVFVL